MQSVPPNKPDLDEYRAKRSADGTPEPMGDGTDARKRLFVLHKHNASRLHWDLRLEFDGVLLSWSVLVTRTKWTRLSLRASFWP